PLPGCVAREFKEAQQKATKWFAALDAARPSAPHVVEFLRLFPEAQVNYRYFAPSHEPGFDLSADLYGRYELTMQLPVVFDSTGSKVVGYGEPNFYLWEVSEVKRSRSGVAEVSFNASGQRHFGSAEWQRIVDSDGDFQAIGYEMIKNQPVDGFQ